MVDGRLSSEERNWAMFAHLSFLLQIVVPFGNLLGPLLIYMAKRDRSSFVAYHATQALVYQLLLIPIYIVLALVSIVLMITVVGMVLLPIPIVLAILAWFYPIVLSIKASNGEWAECAISGGLVTRPTWVADRGARAQPDHDLERSDDDLEPLDVAAGDAASTEPVAPRARRRVGSVRRVPVAPRRRSPVIMIVGLLGAMVLLCMMAFGGCLALVALSEHHDRDLRHHPAPTWEHQGGWEQQGDPSWEEWREPEAPDWRPERGEDGWREAPELSPEAPEEELPAEEPESPTRPRGEYH